MPNNQKKGQWAEEQAVTFLLTAGYTIIERNWRCIYGEIDIVAQDGDIWVFVEVRARHHLDDAFASITSSKREKMIHSAHSYLQKLPLDTPWRVDMIAVAWGPPLQIQHVEDILAW
ncbi:MAG: YraN family protein [Chloroflexi bacterium]|nr:MAG: YraN family protein [Chloroflexota bacterium]